MRIGNFIPIVFVLLWSTGFVGAKYAMPYADPFWFLTIRSLLTIGFLVVLIFLFRKRLYLDNRAFQQLFIGLLIHGGYLGGVFFAISRGMPAGITAVIVGVQPLLTAVFSSSFGGERLKPRIWFGLILGLIAIVLVIFDAKGLSGDRVSKEGIFAAIIALTSISAGTIFQKKWGQGTPFLMSTIYQYIGASIAFLALSLRLDNQVIEWVPSLVMSLLWLVCGLSIGAILLLMYMIREGQVTKVASFFYLVPPVVMIEGYFLFGEKIGLVGILGAVLVVCSIMIVTKSDCNDCH